MSDEHGKMTREERRQMLHNYHATFDSDAGKKVLEYLAVECMDVVKDVNGNLLGTYVPESDRASAFNEGKRAVILRIRSILSAKLD